MKHIISYENISQYAWIELHHGMLSYNSIKFLGTVAVVLNLLIYINNHL